MDAITLGCTEIIFPPPGTIRVVQNNTQKSTRTTAHQFQVSSTSFFFFQFISLSFPHVFLSHSPLSKPSFSPQTQTPVHSPAIPNPQTTLTLPLQIPHLPLLQWRNPMASRGTAVATRRATLAPWGTTLGSRAGLTPPRNLWPQAQNTSPRRSIVGVRSPRINVAGFEGERPHCRDRVGGGGEEEE